MSERIKQMWTKVCQDEMPELDETCMTLQRQEKFAEMIVQECKEAVAKTDPTTSQRAIQAINKELGIK